MAEQNDETGRDKPGSTGAEEVDATTERAAEKTPAPSGSTAAATGGVPGTVSIRVSTVVQAVVIGALAIAVIVLSALLWSARSDLSDRDDRAAAEQRAEQVATDYAVGAATVNYQDINAWVANLKANTAPQLANKFETTAPKLEQILVPLKWTSTASPITAKVMSEQDGVYKVNVFVNVNSTNAQTPDGAQTTVTYNVTLDQKSDWQITDVGGVDGALPTG
ncbi:hypothetical protein [Nocardia donostiensis]|uniref:hypothetical protein n=1 Tax=Nocardia donostiensis TaxID=1538463 RepID=UPI0009D935A9|nr:hypothetical protein [Nocardia donostiensis]